MIKAMLVSSNIHTEDTLLDRPEVYRLVDKSNFSKKNFGEDVFVATVREAVAYARAARRAEGQLPEQQARLDNLPFVTPPAP